LPLANPVGNEADLMGSLELILYSFDKCLDCFYQQEHIPYFHTGLRSVRGLPAPMNNVMPLFYRAINAVQIARKLICNTDLYIFDFLPRCET